jgi:hypothetical protein
LLGGTVGVGTLLYALTIGPLVGVLVPKLTVADRGTGTRGTGTRGTGTRGTGTYGTGTRDTGARPVPIVHTGE